MSFDEGRYKALSTLVEWADNYNQGDVMSIALSIRRFGFNGALRVWGSNIVIAGNHAMKALKLIKVEGPNPDHDLCYPPKHVLTDGDEWHVAFIDVSHLDPLEAKAFAIADNEIARRSIVDDILLSQYLNEIMVQDNAVLQAIGYDAAQVNALIHNVTQTFQPAGLDQQHRLDELNGSYCETCGKRLYDGRR